MARATLPAVMSSLPPPCIWKPTTDVTTVLFLQLFILNPASPHVQSGHPHKVCSQNDNVQNFLNDGLLAVQ